MLAQILCLMPKAKFAILAGLVLFVACTEHPETKLFVEQPVARTGIDFENAVVQDGENNVLNYPYYFNGGGVAVGDINNDGLEDVYFSGNMVPNRLFLNKGDFHFEDITAKAGVGVTEGWKTGVAFVDINRDGWLDIYACRSAMSDSTLRKNLLFINNGDLTFREAANEYGVADDAYTTHAAFLDYDKDGDLDLFVLNHSLPMYASFNSKLSTYKNQKSSSFQSKLFQNDNGRFKDVSEQAGIINNVLSFGLGLAIADINSDGWPDIYISNDFNEEDYLYINNGDGTFTNEIRQATGHVSLFSMGSDVADINNDLRPDIFTLDMLPSGNERIKLSSGDDNYDKYKLLIKSGFHHQTMRNMLQLNNGDGTFSEVGQLMGISNTDWSWAALFADFDGDGWKDLFVSNGYEKDYTNMQFLKYTVDERLKARQTGSPPDVKEIIGQMPSIQVGNLLFRNNRDLTFTPVAGEWGLTRSFKSNGAAYADLDNDGDPDLVINVMNEKAVVYRNTSEENSKNTFLKVDLRKIDPKRIIEGSKVIVYTPGNIQFQEFSPVRGFQSSMYTPLSFGFSGGGTADSIRIIWPDNRTQLITNPARGTITPDYHAAGQTYVYPLKGDPLFKENHAMEWTHAPVDTNDFKRQLLLPKMYSYSGPRMAKGDVNQDGLEDIYVCGARRQPGALFLQQEDGSFREKKNSGFERDKQHQDEAATLFDADGDGDLDLYVVSGGYLFAENDTLLQDRLYINDGRANFRRIAEALPRESLSGSCVVPFDFDNDSDLDLFVGTRLTPGSYPISSPSLLLVNDGKGNFKNAISELAPSLENAGMICDAAAADFNKDGIKDLVVVGEWMPVKIFISGKQGLTDESDKWIQFSAKGWWNCVTVADLDNDGNMDFIAGNYGLNNQFRVSASRPATLIYKDFNNDGQVDPFFCYYIGDRAYPYASRDEALGQVDILRPRFPDYNSYSTATIEIMFTKAELETASRLEADYLKTVVFMNEGDHFGLNELPIQAQYSPVYTIAMFDIDHDGDKDMVLGGNESMVRVRIGRSDANEGMLLLNDGNGHFAYVPQNRSGLCLKGDARQLLFISSRDRICLLAGLTGLPVQSYVLEPGNLPNR